MPSKRPLAKQRRTVAGTVMVSSAAGRGAPRWRSGTGRDGADLVRSGTAGWPPTRLLLRPLGGRPAGKTAVAS